jgi:hypothetical protein
MIRIDTSKIPLENSGNYWIEIQDGKAVVARSFSGQYTEAELLAIVRDMQLVQTVVDMPGQTVVELAYTLALKRFDKQGE